MRRAPIAWQVADGAAARPISILLDLDLPIRDGRQVLAELHADPDLSAIPVVILTASRNEQAVLRAERLAAWAYITKPVDWQQFIAVIEAIEMFALTLAIYPRGLEPTRGNTPASCSSKTSGSSS